MFLIIEACILETLVNKIFALIASNYIGLPKHCTILYKDGQSMKLGFKNFSFIGYACDWLSIT